MPGRTNFTCPYDVHDIVIYKTLLNVSTRTVVVVEEQLMRQNS